MANRKGNPTLKKGVQPEWLKGKDFKARPENRNNNGPRKSIQTIINRMKSDEFEALDKKSLMEVYKLIFNTPENEIMKIANNKDTPWGFKIIVDNLKDKSTRAKAWNDYQTWLFGKAPEEVNITTNNAIDMSDEEKQTLRDSILRKIG